MAYIRTGLEVVEHLFSSLPDWIPRFSATMNIGQLKQAVEILPRSPVYRLSPRPRSMGPHNLKEIPHADGAERSAVFGVPFTRRSTVYP